MKSLPLGIALSALALTLFSQTASAAKPASWVCAPRYPGYALQTYRDYETQTRGWYDRMRAAPVGSNEERFAREEVVRNSDQALGAIRDAAALMNYLSQEVEAVATDATQKQSAAPFGSLLETFYRQASSYTWSGYLRNVNYELSCSAQIDWQSSVQVGEVATQKSKSSPFGSQAEVTYRQVATTAWATARRQVQSFANSQLSNYRDLENMALQFRAYSQSSPFGSEQEKFYTQATDDSFAGSLAKFRYQVKSIPTYDLYNIVSEYDQKARSAPFGSPTERFSRSISAEAQNEIRLRGTNPPPPQPRQFVCTVSTSRNSYRGYGYDSGTALRQARDACSRWEHSSQCFRSPYSCRLQ